jgi:uncharacterized damage-inducible protein DinB
VIPSVEWRELLDYSDHERRKWRQWLQADRHRMDIAFQAGGNFPTIGSLFDHIFLVERRHLCRLEGGVPPDATGVAPGDWEALFEYADFVRADLRHYIADLDEDEANQPMTVVTRAGARTMTRRELAAHILLHEVRHLAQIAYAVRLTGQEPPGQHDLFYFVGSGPAAAT